MNTLYLFASGPLVLFSLSILLLGILSRLAFFFGLCWQKDLSVFVDFKQDWATRSVFHWLFPVNATARLNPITTMAGFAFHLTFLLVAVFLSAHIILWQEGLGWEWWALPDSVADGLTMLFLAAFIFFALRRAFIPRVRALSSWADWLALLLAGLPMITGFFAYHQWGDYKLLITLHVLSGNLLLMAIPFTKLSHMFFFFVARAITGSDFGKRNVGAW